MINMGPVTTGIVSTRTLAEQVVEELDPSFWTHETTDPSAAADLADYVVGSTLAVAANLQSMMVHFVNYKETRFSQDVDMRANVSDHGKPFPTSGDRTHYDEREIRMDAYERGFYVALGSVLDTLAASVIGYAGLALDIHHADFGWLLPMDVQNYPTSVENKRLWNALAPEPPPGRDAQINTVRGLAAALDQSGPRGWVSWALGVRNMVVHREHRTEFIVLGRSKKALTIDRVPVADPSMSNLQAFRSSKRLLEGYYLKEDALTTMKGLIESLNAAVTGTVEVLRHLWNQRRDDPNLIAQPSAQWKERPSQFNFEGYDPGSAIIKDGVSMISNPQDAARLTAAGLITDRPTGIG